MATSSILRDLTIDDPEKVKRFIIALEKAQEIAEADDLTEEEMIYADWLDNPSLKDRLQMKKRHRRRRHHRSRIISKRIDILEGRFVWNSGSMQGYDNLYLKEPGRMSKDNLTCSCWMCKHDKRRKIEKPKYKERLEDYEY